VLLDEPDGVYHWFRAYAAGDSDADDHYRRMLRLASRKYRDLRGRFRRRAGEVSLHAQVRTLVLKAPNLTFDFHVLGTCGLPVSVVYPVRDPRSVVASMMRLQSDRNHADFGNRQLRLLVKRLSSGVKFDREREMLASKSEPLWARCATVWKIKTGLAPRFREAKLDVFQFRYEDLVQRRDLTEELLVHCGLERGMDAFSPEAVYQGKGPGGTDRTRSIDDSSLQSWSDCLDASKEADVMRISHPLALSFGYR
jgi:hypothetical protein